jgi:hypothetical protein
MLGCKPDVRTCVIQEERRPGEPQGEQNMMKLVDTIRLTNGLDMELWDATRAIAADTVRVELIIRVSVEVKPEYFQDSDQYETCKNSLGSAIVFEQRKERSFVPMVLGSNVFHELLAEFKVNSFDYISKPNFPARFVLSKFAELSKNTRNFQ